MLFDFDHSTNIVEFEYTSCFFMSSWQLLSVITHNATRSLNFSIMFKSFLWSVELIGFSLLFSFSSVPNRMPQEMWSQGKSPKQFAHIKKPHKGRQCHVCWYLNVIFSNTFMHQVNIAFHMKEHEKGWMFCLFGAIYSLRCAYVHIYMQMLR